MPELPEVETIARELRERVTGGTIRQVGVNRATPLRNTTAAGFQRFLAGKTLTAVERQGKYLLFRLEPGGLLLAHLRMTGKFVWEDPSATGTNHPHTRVWMELGWEVERRWGRLLYQDTRCLGTLETAQTQDDLPALARLGPDPLSGAFTPDWLASQARRATPLKPWLMNQRVAPGMGNIYASEVCHRAGLSPQRPVNGLAPKEITRLHQQVRQVLGEALAHNGTTVSDYRRVDDKTGGFQQFLRVYGKTGQPCPACRTPIQRILQQQRSTFLCPVCQT
ncbi:MAG: bifunctional DNA-formamidopyrimidine glycosylase/DNA-(apurinic or apyrimidinic site) lyase [Deltaproteobacteria bacterium]|nr:bifunctional DNA-formamidopyrimidine glycosylase/DNA-(apurinic or apyrimidinic site) lyase [Deltaproteobacteria bacterium]